jgi:cytochrome c-type biogenesis protein CcmF
VGGNAWTVRLQVKPFMTWIWTGCILMALGGLLAAGDKRYRRAQEPARAPQPAMPAAARPTREGA